MSPMGWHRPSVRVPAEDLGALNDAIIGRIEIVAEFG
jgi:hypothetical protein